MPKNTKKNQADYNKEARKRYNKANFKYQSVCMKIAELEVVDSDCESCCSQ